ncbi:endonuclease/exonuclease/phosphatase family protein [Chondrinema litorale]|uniref:endonuclease/exonuclease/phosphatase family protein n=1 Tax=Chondrinema litorale TaxID=2994555 RepID=UPI00254346D3|nr:endonuclease/exonuclease/phosphatase family protein [Chondrinema litorale]UZR97981.1 endonuclease/exonuclease/phosphatase family protein [Chondrinema litorale]
MKIVTWNCNGAFRNKYKNIAELDADIYIIQECENPEQTRDTAYKTWASNYLWIGDLKHKGLGVFARNGIQLTSLNWPEEYENHRVKYFLPVSINHDFDLLAVWAHQNKSPTFGYIGQVWKYLQVNKDKLDKTIIAGDLNSNSRWDVWDRWWNHSDVLTILSDAVIESLYHQFYQEKQGEETMPTYFLHRKREKAYHIDYILASQGFREKLISLSVGEFSKWITISDHLPMVCELDYKL